MSGLVSAGCTRAPEAVRPPEPAPVAHQARAIQEVVGKPQAPVVIESVIDGAVAHVTVRFPQGGAGIEVLVSGAEGLAVTGSESLTKDRGVATGEALTFDVPFTPGPGESLLAVRVLGTFGGAHRSAVRAFPVGTRSALQQSKDKEGTATVGGEKVRLVPAEEQQR